MLPHEEGNRGLGAHMGFLSPTNACLSTLQIQNAVRGMCFPSFSVYQLLISVPTEIPGKREKKT